MIGKFGPTEIWLGNPSGSLPVSGDVSEAIAWEELSGLAYIFWGRQVALTVLAAWAVLTVPGLQRHETHTVRGRREPIELWCTGRAEPAPAAEQRL